MENLVKFLCRQKAERNAGLFERNLIFKCLLNGFCRIFISDIRIESRHKHQRIMKIVVHFFPIGLDTDGAILVEGQNCLGKKPCGLKKIIDANGHKHVQLKISL